MSIVASIFFFLVQFSATESIESALFLATGQQVVLSPQNVLECTPNPQHCGGTGRSRSCVNWVVKAAVQSALVVQLTRSLAWLPQPTAEAKSAAMRDVRAVNRRMAHDESGAAPFCQAGVLRDRLDESEDVQPSP